MADGFSSGYLESCIHLVIVMNVFAQISEVESGLKSVVGMQLCSDC